MPQLALEPRSGDAPAHELGHHFDEVGTADELDLVGQPPPRSERMVLLAGIEAETQAVFGPVEWLERSTGIAGRVLDVHIARAAGA